MARFNRLIPDDFKEYWKNATFAQKMLGEKYKGVIVILICILLIILILTS